MNGKSTTESMDSSVSLILALVLTAILPLAGCKNDPPPYSDKPNKRQPSREIQKQPLRIVFYDFDRTIPAIHIYHETKGKEDVSKKNDQFFIDAFGGEKRIARLKIHFGRLTKRGVKCSIVSYGYSAVIKESLARVGLIDFFEADAIIGRDSEIMRRFRGAKHKIISEEMRSRNIPHDEALFIDDDQGNIKKCANAGICRTLHIHEEGGITEENMEFLETGMNEK